MQQLLTIRQLFPPVAAEPPNLNRQSNLEPQNESVETNLTEGQQATSPKMKRLNQSLLKKDPVETKLTGWFTLPRR